MKNITLFLLCFVIPAFSKSQNVDSIRNLLSNKKRDYAFYHQVIKVQDTSITNEYRDIINQIGSFFKPIPELNTVEMDIGKNYIARKAVDILDSIAQKEQIIIFNEAHDNPYHRVATTSYLSTLYKHGFRYLALEALDEKDDTINNRKYPLQDISGYYVNEPCYGDMVREALRLGFTLVAYDFESPIIDLRERKEAENIYNRIFVKNPKAKVVIHCGYGHGQDKKISNELSMMGYYLKDKSRINPFVVNQIYYISDTISEPIFFLSPITNRIWHLPSDYDAEIFLPKPKWVNNRPNWYSIGKKRYEYLPDLKEMNLTPPFLMQAFIKNEGENAVPLDQIEIDDINQPKGLWLYPGSYIFRVIDTQNAVKFKKEIVIEADK